MAKTKVTTAVADAAAKPRLNADERIALLMADHAVQIAIAKEKQAAILLRAQELEAHIALTTTKQQQQEAKDDIAQAKAKVEKLSGELAARYGFDWQDSSYNPITGDIVSVPAKSP